MKPLRCPFCGGEDRIRTRDRRGIWRRRECGYCDERFSTREIVIPSHDPKHRAKMRGQMPLGF